jgi:hypothetical protein
MSRSRWDELLLGQATERFVATSAMQRNGFPSASNIILEDYSGPTMYHVIARHLSTYAQEHRTRCI